MNYAAHADAAEALAADVAEAAAVEAMVARTEAELGPVTILVNNAGVAWQGTLDTYDREQVARTVAAIGTALPGNAFYAAAKAEVVILTRRFAMELGPHGVTVNAVAPGFVRTEMTQRGRGAADWQGTEERC